MAVADQVLGVQIETIFATNTRVYGAPRIHAELVDAGVHVGRKRVARLIRRPTAWAVTAASARSWSPGRVRAPRRLQTGSNATRTPRADQLFVADVIYVPTVQGSLYLACVTVGFFRMISGWSVSHHRKTDLVVEAVTTTVHRRGGKAPGVGYHTNRGGEHTPTS